MKRLLILGFIAMSIGVDTFAAKVIIYRDSCPDSVSYMGKTYSFSHTAGANNEACVYTSAAGDKLVIKKNKNKVRSGDLAPRSKAKKGYGLGGNH